MSEDLYLEPYSAEVRKALNHYFKTNLIEVSKSGAEIPWGERETFLIDEREGLYVMIRASIVADLYYEEQMSVIIDARRNQKLTRNIKFIHFYTDPFSPKGRGPVMTMKENDFGQVYSFGSDSMDFLNNSIVPHDANPYPNQWPSQIELDSLKEKKQVENSSGVEANVESESQVLFVNAEVESNIENFKGAIYAVTAFIKNVDESRMFFERKTWYSNLKGSTLRSLDKRIMPGDILVMKTANARKGGAVLRVKAIGISEGRSTDKKLKVNWKFIPLSGFVDVPGRINRHRGPIAELTKDEYKKVLAELDSSEFYDSGLHQNVEESKKKSHDKIPFLFDNAETEDRLSREPVAKSLCRLINEDVFDSKNDYSFMIHLRGEWGAGKSTFLNLVEKNLDTDKRKWVVIKFNAWRNQHISPPWWSLIDQVYIDGTSKLSWFGRRRIHFSEKGRRVLKHTKVKQFVLFVISLVLFALLASNHRSIFGSIGLNFNDKGLITSNTLKAIIALGGVLTLIYSFSRFMVTPFFVRSSQQAKDYMNHTSDPMIRVMDHFEKLIKDLNTEDKEVAIFIDDLDRCNADYAVSLLEGIQTMFREKRVLYIVAADKKWLSTCFETHYKDFKESVPDKSQSLGELFIEKAFQLSMRLPQMSESIKANYWKYILQEKEEEPKEQEESVIKEAKTELKEAFAKGERSSAKVLEIQEKYNVNQKQMSDVTFDVIDGNFEDVNHLLKEYHDLIEPNPRAIKRLANEYTMYRNILFAESRFDEGDQKFIFRWLILENRYPLLAEEIKSDLDLLINDEKLDELLKSKEAVDGKKLLKDSENKYGGPLTKEVVAKIVGK